MSAISGNARDFQSTDGDEWMVNARIEVTLYPKVPGQMGQIAINAVERLIADTIAEDAGILLDAMANE